MIPQTAETGKQSNESTGEGGNLVGHVVAMVEFYRNKMRSGELTASEGSVYLKCLGILGVGDAVTKNRDLGKTARMLDGLELPFPESR